MASNIDKEKVTKTIAVLMDEINAEADSPLYREYFNLFRKEISLFNRTKTGAYLLMLLDQGKPLNLNRKDYSRRKENESSSKENNLYSLTKENSVRLFFSVGKNKKIYPYEILGLICSKTGLPKDDVGAIRILVNYTFVQVRDTSAEKIVQNLNGIVFKGKTLTVNYAKSNKDKADSEQDVDYQEEKEGI